MGKLRCSKCKELAHTLIDKKAYCLTCAPKPEESKPVEVVKEESPTKVILDKVSNIEVERIEQRKSWWRKHG